MCVCVCARLGRAATTAVTAEMPPSDAKAERPLCTKLSPNNVPATRILHSSSQIVPCDACSSPINLKQIVHRSLISHDMLCEPCLDLEKSWQVGLDDEALLWFPCEEERLG